jgi:hypothetical protein
MAAYSLVQWTLPRVNEYIALLSAVKIAIKGSHTSNALGPCSNIVLHAQPWALWECSGVHAAAVALTLPDILPQYLGITVFAHQRNCRRCGEPSYKVCCRSAVEESSGALITGVSDLHLLQHRSGPASCGSLDMEVIF